MFAVSEHKTCGVSGRGYREFQGVKYWFWASSGIYANQSGGKAKLLHLEIYRAIHGELPFRTKPRPLDGDIENTSPENWVVSMRKMERKHPVQEFNGVRFYWKPEGYFKSDRVRHGGVAMHRYVWEFHNGKIPSGFHVHHKDSNKGNNNIANLELLAASEHSLLHAPRNKWVGSEENANQLRSAGEKSKAWHASKEGLDWHSKHGARTWKDREWLPVKCFECGREFFSPFPSRAKYCDNNCKSRASRRAKGETVGVRPVRREASLLLGKRATGKQ